MKFAAGYFLGGLICYLIMSPKCHAGEMPDEFSYQFNDVTLLELYPDVCDKSNVTSGQSAVVTVNGNEKSAACWWFLGASNVKVLSVDGMVFIVPSSVFRSK